MAEVNDEATNALIASLLAEDNHYTEYDAYNMGADSGDDDWGGSKKKAKKGMPVQRHQVTAHFFLNTGMVLQPVLHLKSHLAVFCCL